MKKAITLFGCFMLSCSTSFAYDINSYCAEVAKVAGGSYQIEETCRSQERQAKQNINRMSVPSRVEKYCKEIGQVAGGSYQIMETCIKQELGAKSRMN
ncbi:hypothetical protein KAR91_19790 [Candidatus Pacearchaeota archaeon]|nr:hypothetical protein [Candidatus Pacearchaeota archaeon]